MLKNVFIRTFPFACLFAASFAQADETTLFLTRPNQVLKFINLNGDGDFFETGEVRIYAESLPASLGAIAIDNDRIYVVAPASGSILLLQDLNGDDDALDFAEISTYVTLPVTSSVAVGLALESEGALLCAESTTGRLYRITDLNADGDALDINEVIMIAEGLSASRAVAIRPDGKVLIAQALTAVPVRILHDRTGDGDFLDFAENLSYAENLSGVEDLALVDNWRSFIVRSTSNETFLLHDQTGDDDALDFNEMQTFGPVVSASVALTLDGEGGFFLATQNVTGTIYHAVDLNGDGDVLDFGEVLPVAQGITSISRIYHPTTSVEVPCILGDVDRNGIIALADVAPFVSMLLGFTPPGDFCAVDMNQDAVLNGRDVQAFVGLLIP